MTFQWPELLWLLALIPLLVALYFWVLAAQEEVRAALRQPRHRQGSDGVRYRRAPPHSAAAVSCSGLTVLVLAIARPTATVLLPSQNETIISPWTCRAACAPPTSSRTAWSPRRSRPRRSSTRCRRACASACGLRRHRHRGAGADPQQGRHRRRDRPLPAAARYRDRQRHPGIARDPVPEHRHRSRQLYLSGPEEPRLGDRAGQPGVAQAGRNRAPTTPR